MCLAACSLMGYFKRIWKLWEVCHWRKALRVFYPGSTFNLPSESHFLLKIGSRNFLFLAICYSTKHEYLCNQKAVYYSENIHATDAMDTYVDTCRYCYYSSQDSHLDKNVDNFSPSSAFIAPSGSLIGSQQGRNFKFSSCLLFSCPTTIVYGVSINMVLSSNSSGKSRTITRAHTVLWDSKTSLTNNSHLWVPDFYLIMYDF